MRFRSVFTIRGLLFVMALVMGFAAVLGLGAGSGAPGAGIPIVHASEAESLADLLKTADELYATRSDPANQQKSIDILDKLLASANANANGNTNANAGSNANTSASGDNSAAYEALWRLGRAYRWQAEKAQASGGERMKLLEKAKDYAERATRANEQGADGHYWLGVILGRVGEERGVLNSLFLIKPIRQEMEKVLAIDPKYAGAHHVLGVLYRKAPPRPLSVGDIKKALQEANLAVKYAPADTLYRVGLAEVHIALKEYDKARGILEEAIKMPPTPGDEPAGEMDKATARELLKQIEKK